MRVSLLLSCVLWLACSSPASQGVDAGSPDGGDPGSTTLDAGTPDAGTTPAASCLEAGGVCTSNASDSASGGGTVRAEFDGECVFDDGPGTCCVPPAVKPSGDTCADYGGVCAPIGGCLREEVKGHFAPPSCGFNPSFACCVPASACPEPRPVCCSETATFRASCARGTYQCFDPSMPLKYVESCQ